MITPPLDSRQNLCIEQAHRLRDDIQLRRTVDFVAVDRFAVVAAGPHVVDGAGESAAKGADHKRLPMPVIKMAELDTQSVLCCGSRLIQSPISETATCSIEAMF